MTKSTANTTTKANKYQVAVVGARGYSGAELCRILLNHPEANLFAVIATNDAFHLKDILPEASAKHVPTWTLEQLNANLSKIHTVFLATPAEVSAALAPKILSAGSNVIDLSGAFRLRGLNMLETKEAYKKWYAMDHPAVDLVHQATYGLQPFSAAERPNGTNMVKTNAGKLIANPGCFATAVLLALVPLVKAGVIDSETIVIDAKSGSTGGGKRADEKLLFSEVEGECRPYKVASHQHFPEITGAMARFTGEKEASPFFNTHLLNVRRGILASIYAKASGSLEGKRFEESVENAFAASYEGYSLVQFEKFDDVPQNVLLKRVVGSARTHLTYKVDGSKLYLFSVLDNLLKGAASQAVENFNQLLDRPVDLGLSGMEGVL